MLYVCNQNYLLDFYQYSYLKFNPIYPFILIIIQVHICLQSICIPLSYIINSSIIQGDFPEELKLAKVIPIYKADNEQHI